MANLKTKANNITLGEITTQSRKTADTRYTEFRETAEGKELCLPQKIHKSHHLKRQQFVKKLFQLHKIHHIHHPNLIPEDKEAVPATENTSQSSPKRERERERE